MAKAKAKARTVKRIEPVAPKAVDAEWIEVEAERKCGFCKTIAPPRYDNRENARCTACWERFPSK